MDDSGWSCDRVSPATGADRTAYCADCGVGSGYEIEHCGKLSSLTLGPIEYKPVPACDSEAFARNEILVGLDFMKAFNYVFSYPDGIVVLTPRKNR